MFTGWREMEMEIRLTTKIPSSSQDAEATGYPKGRSTSLSYKYSITLKYNNFCFLTPMQRHM